MGVFFFFFEQKSEYGQKNHFNGLGIYFGSRSLVFQNFLVRRNFCDFGQIFEILTFRYLFWPKWSKLKSLYFSQFLMKLHAAEICWRWKGVFSHPKYKFGQKFLPGSEISVKNTNFEKISVLLK